MTKFSRDQIEHIKALLDVHRELTPQLLRTLFSSEKQEYELTYAGKQSEEDMDCTPSTRPQVKSNLPI